MRLLCTLRWCNAQRALPAAALLGAMSQRVSLFPMRHGVELTECVGGCHLPC